MVRVAGLAAADEAGLFGHKTQMLLVPKPFRLWQGQDTFVDAGMSVGIGRQWVRFGAREAWDCLEPGEPDLKCRPDVVSIRRRQAVCLRPGMKRPGVEFVLRNESSKVVQQLIPEDCRGFNGQGASPSTVCALPRPMEPVY